MDELAKYYITMFARLLTLPLVSVALSQSVQAQISLLFTHNINTDTLTLTATGTFDPDSVTAPGAAVDTLYIEQDDASNRTFIGGSGTLQIDGQAPNSSNGGNENFAGGTHYLLLSFASNFSTTGEWTVTGSSYQWTHEQTGQPLPLTSTGPVYWGDAGSGPGPEIGTYTLNTVPEPGAAALLVAIIIAPAAVWMRRKRR